MDPWGFRRWRRRRQLNVLATTGACAPCRAPVAGPAACTDLSASQPRPGAQPASRSARSSRSRSFPGRGRSRDRLRRQFSSRPLEKHLARPGQPVALPPYCACVSSRIGTHHKSRPRHRDPHPRSTPWTPPPQPPSSSSPATAAAPKSPHRLLLRRRSRPALHRQLHHPIPRGPRTSSRPSEAPGPGKKLIVGVHAALYDSPPPDRRRATSGQPEAPAGSRALAASRFRARSASEMCAYQPCSCHPGSWPGAAGPGRGTRGTLTDRPRRRATVAQSPIN